MRLVVLGAGSMGSFLGGMLSKTNDVTLVGRRPHMDAINKIGLHISGVTQDTIEVNCATDLDNLPMPEVLLLSAKAYDTEAAMSQAIDAYGKEIRVLSIQNGIGNLERITEMKGSDNGVYGCATSHHVLRGA